MKAHARIVSKVKKVLGGSLKGKNISVWGLAFKANTDDIRFSPAISVIELLISEGAQIKAFDPVVKQVKELAIEIKSEIVQSVENADVIVVLTEWQEFKLVDPALINKLVKQKIVVDARNLLDKEKWVNSDFIFIGNGYN